jgi:hypothetical protein
MTPFGCIPNLWLPRRADAGTSRRRTPMQQPEVRRSGKRANGSVAAYCIALTALLGGCSASELVQNGTLGPAADLSQPNYQRIVADNIRTVFPNQSVLGDLEISGVRLVDHLKGPAWLTCLKLDAHGNPQHYAIFIQQDKIIDWRAGVVIDRCSKESYQPFTPSAKHDKLAN